MADLKAGIGFQVKISKGALAGVAIARNAEKLVDYFGGKMTDLAADSINVMRTILNTGIQRRTGRLEDYSTTIIGPTEEGVRPKKIVIGIGDGDLLDTLTAGEHYTQVFGDNAKRYWEIIEDGSVAHSIPTYAAADPPYAKQKGKWMHWEDGDEDVFIPKVAAIIDHPGFAGIGYFRQTAQFINDNLGSRQESWFNELYSRVKAVMPPVGPVNIRRASRLLAQGSSRGGREMAALRWQKYYAERGQ